MTTTIKLMNKENGELPPEPPRSFDDLLEIAVSTALTVAETLFSEGKTTSAQKIQLVSLLLQARQDRLKMLQVERIAYDAGKQAAYAEFTRAFQTQDTTPEAQAPKQPPKDTPLAPFPTWPTD